MITERDLVQRGKVFQAEGRVQTKPCGEESKESIQGMVRS